LALQLSKDSSASVFNAVRLEAQRLRPFDLQYGPENRAHGCFSRGEFPLLNQLANSGGYFLKACEELEAGAEGARVRPRLWVFPV